MIFMQSIISRPDNSIVFATILVTRKNKFTRILGIKKEPNGSDVKNIKSVIVIDYLKFPDNSVLIKIYKKVSFYSLHAVEGSRLPALLVKLSLKFCR